jgi:hypothetical protein
MPIEPKALSIATTLQRVQPMLAAREFSNAQAKHMHESYTLNHIMALPYLHSQNCQMHLDGAMKRIAFEQR